MVLDKGICLRYYKRKEIQEAILAHSQNKEVGTRYGDNFGKRPDALRYPKEIIELALQGVTSFHTSEELWDNPLYLTSEMSRKELDDLRTGWDLVLDIDCPDWEFSKLTTYLFIKALKENYVKEISCKFSGNKGFHIGVPFEAFPPEIAGKKTKDLFPLGPQKIAQFLLNYISERFINIKENKIFFDKNFSYAFSQLKEKFGEREFLIHLCKKCGQKINFPSGEEEYEFICPKCEERLKSKKEFELCPKCRGHMERFENRKNLCSCGSNEYFTRFDPLALIEVDTILISSRHLYRMPYSLHEKSGLVSLPLNPQEVLSFEKSLARPEKVNTSGKFLERQGIEESAGQLLLQALDFQVKWEESQDKKSFEEMKISSPVKEEFFPPCVKAILRGVEDGKKRSVFILMNFLGKLGWNKKEIEDFIFTWNKEKNSPSLKEGYIKSQLKSFTAGDKLPPNCDNEGYYLGIGKCFPDSLCQRIKNPVNYTLLKWKSYRRDREEEEEKEIRKSRKKKVKEEKKEEEKEKNLDSQKEK